MTTTPTDTDQGIAQQNNTPRLEIQKIYLKDASWEAPNTPESFQHQWQPEVNIEVKNQVKKRENNLYEASIHITITCRNQKKIAFIIELEQAGLFLMEHISDQERDRVMGTICPNTLFPYAREAIDSMVVKGGFAPVMLAPINFDSLYAQALKKKQKEQKMNEQPKPDDAGHHVTH